jgi:hypothetical protein
MSQIFHIYGVTNLVPPVVKDPIIHKNLLRDLHAFQALSKYRQLKIAAFCHTFWTIHKQQAEECSGLFLQLLRSQVALWSELFCIISVEEKRSLTEMRTCIRCKQRKPLFAFVACPDCKGGRKFICKACLGIFSPKTLMQRAARTIDGTVSGGITIP